MRWTMLMPIAVVGLAAVSCFGIRRVVTGPSSPATAPDADVQALR
jgi:hypothetical protein